MYLLVMFAGAWQLTRWLFALVDRIERGGVHKDNMCRIPVSATFTVYKGSSTPIMTKAEYVDIPADAIARFLLERFGADAIFNGGRRDGDL